MVRTTNTQQQGALIGIFGTLAQAALGYLRWSQMVPMLLAWTFVVLGVIGALFIGFQQEGVAVLAWLHEQAGRVPGLRQWLGESLQGSGAVTERGGIHLTDEHIVPLVVRGWAAFSAVLLVLEWIWGLLRRGEPRPPWPLRRKLAIALMACVIAIGIMVLGLAAAGAGQDVSAGEAVLPVLVALLLLFGISAYSLTATHLIAWIQRHLDTPASAAPKLVRLATPRR